MWEWGEDQCDNEAAMNERIARYLVEELENRHLGQVEGPDGRTYVIRVRVEIEPAPI